MSPFEPPRPVREIPIQLIDEPVLPSRSDMDDVEMDLLVDSIRAVGILQNLVLEERGDRFRVAAGHRRLIAARRAGLPSVPAKVYPPGHPSLVVIQCHENGRREDVNPVDEAFWFAELLESQCGQDVERLAGLVGEKLSYVLGRLELLELDEETRDALRAGKIKIGVALALRKCSAPDYRHYLLTLALRDGATVGSVESWVQSWRRDILEPSQLTPPAPVRPVSAVPGQAYDPLRCYICGKSDHRIPEQVAIHTSCREAILDALLAGAAPSTRADS